MVLRIFNIATSDFLAALKCTKLVFGLGSAQDWCNLQSSFRRSSWFKGPYF